MCQVLHVLTKNVLGSEVGIESVLQMRVPRLTGVSAGAGLSPVRTPRAMLYPRRATASQEPPAEVGVGRRLSSFELWPRHLDCQLQALSW